MLTSVGTRYGQRRAACRPRVVRPRPQVEPTGKAGGSSPGGGGAKPGAGGAGASGHDLTLVLERGVVAAVRLPWVACQKQPPEEAEVLRTLKGFYR